LRPFDLIYVVNASQVDITKVLNFIDAATGTADSSVNLVNDVLVARINSRLQ
jgi:polysaccharide export outer membrane protein